MPDIPDMLLSPHSLPGRLPPDAVDRRHTVQIDLTCVAAHASASSSRKRERQAKPAVADGGKPKAPRVRRYKSVVLADASTSWLAGKGLTHMDLAFASMRGIMDYAEWRTQKPWATQVRLPAEIDEW